MNYRHAFHAGGYADVIKHVTLTTLIHSFLQKPTPYCYIDTHAGLGFYDLFIDFSGAKKEYKMGIEKIIQQNAPPSEIKRYLTCVQFINNKLANSKYASLRFYPGSSMIARYFARAQDKIILCELQPQQYQSLRNHFAGDTQVAVHHMDGYQGLKAFLPPREKRGLILIDPPYEHFKEFERIIQHVSMALKRFQNGVYAIWYPIKDRLILQKFKSDLKEKINLPIFDLEITIYPEIEQHLNGCGMLVINPPWKFDQKIKPLLTWLWKALTINRQGGYRSSFLKSR